MDLFMATLVSIMLMILGSAGIIMGVCIFTGNVYASMSVGIICFIAGIAMLIGGYKLCTWLHGDPIKKAKTAKEKENYLEELKTIEPLEKLKVDCMKSRENASYIDRLGEKTYKHAHVDIKKKDWAIRGGLAQGIAGVGAGVAVAAKAMADNAGVDEANQKSKALYGKMESECAVNAKNIEREYDFLYENLEYIIPNHDLPAELLMKQLSINKVKIEKGNDNKWYLTVRIVNNSKYVIDGAIKASVYTTDGKEVYNKVISLPFMGCLQEYNVTYNLSNIQPNNNYEVKVEPCNLWTYKEVANKGLLNLKLTNIDKDKLKIVGEENFNKFSTLVLKGNSEYTHRMACESRTKGDILTKKNQEDIKKKIDKIIAADSSKIKPVLFEEYLNEKDYTERNYGDLATRLIYILAPTKELFTRKQLARMLSCSEQKTYAFMNMLCYKGICGCINVYNKQLSRNEEKYYLEEEFINKLYEKLLK